MIKGIDVSKWDGAGGHLIDWKQYSHKFDFAFFKVSDGNVIDPVFKDQWNAARGKTLRSAYHFFHPNLDPKASVQKTISYLEGDLGELPLMFDMEVADNVGDPFVQAKSWLSWYEQLTGIRPIFYSSPNFLYQYHSEKNLWLSNYILHLAEYPWDNLAVEQRTPKLHDVLEDKVPYHFPLPPKPFNKVWFWQWTGKGNPEDVPGYYLGANHKLAVDFNMFNGTASEFSSLFHLSDMPSTSKTINTISIDYTENGERKVFKFP